MENSLPPDILNLEPPEKSMFRKDATVFKIAIILLIILLPVVGILGFVIGRQVANSAKEEISNKPVPESENVVENSTSVTSRISPNPATNTYQNARYKISFALNNGERVIECPNMNEFNDNVGLWIVDAPPLAAGIDPTLECATEGPFNALFMTKKSQGAQTIEEYIAVLEGPENRYTITRTPISVSGVSGVRVVGSRDTTVPAPLPDYIDVSLFERGETLYVIPEKYMNQGFTFLE